MYNKMFTQSICLTHYSEDFIARLQMLGYKESSSFKFEGTDKKTRDDLCICTSIEIAGDSYDYSVYCIIDKDIAMNDDPHIGWKQYGNRYVTDNEDLAFALASMNNNEVDKYSFFTVDCNFQFDNRETIKQGSVVFCTRLTWNLDFDTDGNPLKYSSRNVPAHRSTKEELINYFSKDKK